MFPATNMFFGENITGPGMIHGASGVRGGTGRGLRGIPVQERKQGGSNSVRTVELWGGVDCVVYM